MLKVIKDDLKKNYYDPSIRGMDIEARFKTADEKMKTADSIGQVFGIIAQVLLELDDSHTYFLPPGRSNRTDYGWRIQSIGSNCFVSAVKPGSDAEAKGLKVGDQILSMSGYQPSRENLTTIEYLFNTLRPQPGLSLVVKKPDGQQLQLDVMAKIKQGKLVKDLTSTMDYSDYMRESEDEDRLSRPRHVEVGDDLMIYKMPDFSINESAVDSMIGKARKYPLLILDLRGNPGGYVKTLEWMMGYFTDKEDMKIADFKGRKEAANGQAAQRPAVQRQAGRFSRQRFRFSRRDICSRHTIRKTRHGDWRPLGRRCHAFSLSRPRAWNRYGCPIRSQHYRRRRHHGRRQKPGKSRRDS
jgi:C-terminal processing protease CtpA/Prc